MLSDLQTCTRQQQSAVAPSLPSAHCRLTAACADNDTADSGAAAAVVRSVVSVRLEQLDATFLATLDAYIRGAAEKGASDVAGGCSGVASAG
jgi:hypothetical protein